MAFSLTVVLGIFLVGFALHRHTTVKIGIAAAFLFGALLVRDGSPFTEWVVHTLDGAFSSLT